MSSGRKSLLAAFTQQQSRAQSLRTAVRRMEARPSSKPQPNPAVRASRQAATTTQHRSNSARAPTSTASSPASVVHSPSRSNSPAVALPLQVEAKPRSPPPSPASQLQIPATVTASPHLGIPATPPPQPPQLQPQLQPQTKAIEEAPSLCKHFSELQLPHGSRFAGAELRLPPPPRPVARFDLMKWTTVIIGTLIVGLVIYKVYRFVKNRRAKANQTKGKNSSSSSGAGVGEAAAPAPPTLTIRQDESSLQQRIPNFVKSSKPSKAGAPSQIQLGHVAKRPTSAKASWSSERSEGAPPAPLERTFTEVPKGSGAAAKTPRSASLHSPMKKPISVPGAASEFRLPAREEVAVETVQQQQPEAEAAVAAPSEEREPAPPPPPPPPTTTTTAAAAAAAGAAAAGAGMPEALPESGVTIEVEADEVESFLDAMQEPSSFAPSALGAPTSAGYPVP
jgi:hypothetical protein